MRAKFKKKNEFNSLLICETYRRIARVYFFFSSRSNSRDREEACGSRERDSNSFAITQRAYKVPLPDVVKRHFRAWATACFEVQQRRLWRNCITVRAAVRFVSVSLRVSFSRRMIAMSLPQDSPPNDDVVLTLHFHDDAHAIVDSRFQRNSRFIVQFLAYRAYVLHFLQISGNSSR